MSTLVGSGVGAGLRGSRRRPFNPARIPGGATPSLWLPGAASAKTLVSSNISSWADSIASHAVTQGTAGNRPPAVAAGFGDLSSADCSALNKSLVGAAISTCFTAAALTLGLVATVNSIVNNSATGYNNDCGLEANNVYAGLYFKNNAAPQALWYAYDGADKVVLSHAGDLVLGQRCVIVVRKGATVAGGSPGIAISINGLNEQTAACGNIANMTGLLTLGSHANTRGLGGSIGEVVAYASDVGTAGLAWLVAELKHKWSIT